jgi:hypothetical protein
VTTGEPRFVDQLEGLTASEDHEYAVVSIALRNFSATPLSYNRFDFLLDSGQGSPVAPTIVHSLESQLQVGDLEPGATVVGLLPFEIPKGARDLALLYSPLCDPACPVERLPLAAGSVER